MKLVLIFKELQAHTFMLIFFLLISDISITEPDTVNYASDSSKDEPQHNKDNQLSEFMNMCYERNFTRTKGGYRYDNDLKLFLAYMRMLSGKLAYETLKANAKYSVPSVKTIDRFIAHIKSTADEGVLRTEELLKYLKDLNLPLYVSLSEDQTKITGRIQYDPRTNRIVGFVLPLNKENGMPCTTGNEAKSAFAIEQCFYDVNTGKEKISAQYVNVIMAQPLVQGIPAFCLAIYGSDNTFESIDVHKKWKYIIEELRKLNIEVANVSSDSDPRYNSAMRKCINLGQRFSDVPIWFNANLQCDYIPTQDTIHIGTKLRNRILNGTAQFGKHIITVDHLMKLVRSFPKTQHKLCESIIKITDRQNFDSVLRICDEKVISLLVSGVKGSDGTVMYLRIINSILKPFLDETLTPLERIRHIWFANFMLRIWREFILKSKKRYSLKNHFITANSYVCVEINAHSLVMLMLYLKEKNMDSLFVPVLLGSQPCEGNFRQIRSLSTANSQVTECSVLEILQRISKIELQNEISHISLKHFDFPRIGKPSGSYYSKIDRNGQNQSNKRTVLPDKEAIFNEIHLAMLEAIEYAESLGVSISKPNELACSVPISEFSDDIVENTEAVLLLNDHIDPDILQSFSEINLNDYSNKKINIDEITEKSVFVKVKNNKQEIFCVHKRLLCYLLSKSTTKLSSDRLRRVMAKRT